MMSDRIKYVTVVTDNEAIASQDNIQAIPTILIFQNGEISDRFPDLILQQALAAKLTALSVLTSELLLSP